MIENNTQPVEDADPQGVTEDQADIDVSGDEETSQVDMQQAAATVEAILFSTDTPMAAAKIAQVAELSSLRYVRKAVKLLNDRYEASGTSFRIGELSGGYQMQTLTDYHDVLERMFKARSDSKLSQAAMETLAIIAYRQPILRADIEAIRGVASGEVLRKLMEKQLVKIVGRAEVLGRPMLYGTSRKFLEIFGLKSLDDLPRADELKSPQEKNKEKYQPKQTAERPSQESDTQPQPENSSAGLHEQPTEQAQ